ncbi:restriction endonuclease subunit S [Fictibacillus phosphorivorans]|uniref:Restriction endonuclease subunit S n=1 Tax=Fictibacillus phosphorivorans TaxID=1221500 RepID=A0A165NNA2_9BACL|nr:restriction endonuclease subunit S [Fictibacillus phosphorivorans]KZE66875.1 restriction endonuclease subunit S [Fictibacillus phosphorivorans]
MKTIKLQDIAIITQGANVSRLETSKDDSDSIKVDVLTLKEFNETLGLSYRMTQEKSQSVYIKEDKLKDQLLTKEKRLIVHLLSQKAAFLPQQYTGRLIPSNFVALDFHENIDTKFMEWYFNEHPSIRRQIMLGTQGSIVSTLSLATLRELDVSVPPLSVQQRIGSISNLYHKKKQLVEERMNLEGSLIHQKIMESLEEYK